MLSLMSKQFHVFNFIALNCIKFIQKPVQFILNMAKKPEHVRNNTHTQTRSLLCMGIGFDRVRSIIIGRGLFLIQPISTMVCIYSTSILVDSLVCILRYLLSIFYWPASTVTIQE